MTYPTDITPDETAAGFECVEINNPEGLSLPPKKVPAVARKHSITGTAAVKMISPSGGMTVYAIWDATRRPPLISQTPWPRSSSVTLRRPDRRSAARTAWPVPCSTC